MKKIVIIISIIIFITGCKNIEYQKYPDGSIKSEIPKDYSGRYHGKALFYFDNGKVEKEVIYDKGQVKTCKVYYPTGELYWKSPFNHNKRDGEYFEYFKNGNIKKKVFYKLGVTKKYAEYDSSQNLVYDYKELTIDSLPEFYIDYVNVGRISQYTFNEIKFAIPGVPSSQLTPVVTNGVIKVKDRVNGIWEIKANKDDSVNIGLNLTINDTTEIIYSWVKFPVDD